MDDTDDLRRGAYPTHQPWDTRLVVSVYTTLFFFYEHRREGRSALLMPARRPAANSRRQTHGQSSRCELFISSLLACHYPLPTRMSCHVISYRSGSVHILLPYYLYQLAPTRPDFQNPGYSHTYIHAAVAWVRTRDNHLPTGKVPQSKVSCPGDL